MNENELQQEQVNAEAIQAETPVETEVTEVEPTEVVEGEQEQTEVTEATEDHKNGFQKRIERFNRKIAEKDQELEYWRKLALQNKPELAAQPAAQVKSDKPQLADFQNIEDYTEAVTDWKLNQRELARTQEKVVSTYNQRAKEFSKEHPDYDEVLDSTNHIPVQPEIHNMILESDVGPQIAYHLATTPTELERLNSLPSHRRLIELGKLEDRFANKKAPPVVKATKAAPPVKTVTGAAPTKKELTDPNLSQAEYRQMRMAQLKNRR